MKHKGWVVIGALLIFLLPLASVSEILAEKNKKQVSSSSVKSSAEPAALGRGSVVQPSGSGSLASAVKGSGRWGRHGGYYGHGYYGYYGGWPYYFYNPWFYWGPFYGYYYQYPVSGDEYWAGKVKTKIKPDSAKVYVNGYLVGIADDFNGPFQYLYLKSGEYRLTFREKGYKPYMADVFVRPRHTTDIKYVLEQGEDILPEATEMSIAPTGEADRPDRPAPLEEEVGIEEKAGPTTHYMDSGRIILTVRPADASIYIDGQFWGTLETTRNRLGIIRLEPGSHLVEVTRPGYHGMKSELVVEKGKDATLNIELAEEP